MGEILKSRHKFSKLRARASTAIKFLFFMEDNPKHFVVESPRTVQILFLTMVSAMGVMSLILLHIYKYFGALGAITTYLFTVIVTLEVLHVVYDR